MNQNDIVEFNVDPKNRPIIIRQLLGKTKRDLEIEGLPFPKGPLWLILVVGSIRFYQKYISKKLGNRCVYDPSCSRYSELAFREKGFIKGLLLTIQRLKICKPQNGGIDELK